METWLAFAIIAVLVVTTAVVVYKIGVYEGKLAEQKRKKGETFYYPETSRPTQQSGTRTQERGSDDTG